MIKDKSYYYKINNIELKFDKNENLIYLFTKVSCIKIFLPSFYFYLISHNNINFIYLKRVSYFNVLRHLLNNFGTYNKFFFFRIRLRGLGYKLEKYATKLYRFFFAYNHYFYFHVPTDIFIKNRKRTLLAFSNSKSKLNDVFSHLLLLKKLDLYERNNSFIVSKQIKFFKKRK
jgi:hypothetical protein